MWLHHTHTHLLHRVIFLQYTIHQRQLASTASERRQVDFLKWRTHRFFYYFFNSRRTVVQSTFEDTQVNCTSVKWLFICYQDYKWSCSLVVLTCTTLEITRGNPLVSYHPLRMKLWPFMSYIKPTCWWFKKLLLKCIEFHEEQWPRLTS